MLDDTTINIGITTPGGTPVARALFCDGDDDRLTAVSIGRRREDVRMAELTAASSAAAIEKQPKDHRTDLVQMSTPDMARAFEQMSFFREDLQAGADVVLVALPSRVEVTAHACVLAASSPRLRRLLLAANDPHHHPYHQHHRRHESHESHDHEHHQAPGGGGGPCRRTLVFEDTDPTALRQVVDFLYALPVIFPNTEQLDTGSRVGGGEGRGRDGSGASLLARATAGVGSPFHAAPKPQTPPHTPFQTPPLAPLAALERLLEVAMRLEVAPLVSHCARRLALASGDASEAQGTAGHVTADAAAKARALGLVGQFFLLGR